MDVSKIAPYAKFVVAICGALVVTANCVADGTLSFNEVNTLLTAWAGALGVYLIPNGAK